MKRIVKGIGIAVASVALTASAFAGTGYNFSFGYSGGGYCRPFYRPWGYPRSYVSLGYVYAPPVYYGPPAYEYESPPAVGAPQNNPPVYLYQGGSFYQY